jgi:hypothetical protein
MASDDADLERLEFYLNESPFARKVREELRYARGKHAPHRSPHESYAVLLDQMDRLWAAVRSKAGTGCHDVMLAEVARVAAMAQRFAEDLGLIPRE